MTIHSINEKQNLPEFIISLQSDIFDGLSCELSPVWKERLFNSIAQGIDLTPVLPTFLLKILDHLPKQKKVEVINAIEGIREVMRNWIDTGKRDVNAARAASDAAYDTANEVDDSPFAYAAAAAVGFIDAAHGSAYLIAHNSSSYTHIPVENYWKLIADDLIASIEEVTAKQQTENAL